MASYSFILLLAPLLALFIGHSAATHAPANLLGKRHAALVHGLLEPRQATSTKPPQPSTTPMSQDCIRICNAVNNLLGKGCPLADCCTNGFFDGFTACFVCQAVAVGNTQYTNWIPVQNDMNSMRETCIRAGRPVEEQYLPGLEPSRTAPRNLATGNLTISRTQQTSTLAPVVTTTSSSRPTTTTPAPAPIAPSTSATPSSVSPTAVTIPPSNNLAAQQPQSTTTSTSQSLDATAPGLGDPEPLTGTSTSTERPASTGNILNGNGAIGMRGGDVFWGLGTSFIALVASVSLLL